MIAVWRGVLRRDLPLAPDAPDALLCGIVALLVYVAGLAAVGWFLLGGSLRAADAALAANWSVQVPADASKARLETVLALLRQTRGIAAVDLVEPAEVARLLEPWLGPAVSPEELPLPRLIDLAIDRGAAPDAAALRGQLALIVPEARLDERQPWPPGMRAATQGIARLLAAVVGLALILVATAAIAAARGIAISGRSPAALLHVLGATDAFIARQFAFHAARLAVAGGALGAGAAVLTILALGGTGAFVQFPVPLVAVGFDDWRVWAILAGLVAAAALLAMVGVALAMRRRLGRLP